MSTNEATWQTVRRSKRTVVKASSERKSQSTVQHVTLTDQNRNPAGECQRVKERILNCMGELKSWELLYSYQEIIQTSLNKCLQSVQIGRSYAVPCQNSHENTNQEQTQVKQRITTPVTGGTQESDAQDTVICICYGIGNFSTCVIACYQLALLLLILRELQIAEERCHIYDPMFTEKEINLLKEFGLKVLCENEEGKHEVENPTLFYMIHCGKALYNNLLWRNWVPESLSKVVIIGNSFQAIEQRLLTRILQKDYMYIAKILQFTEEVPLPISTRYLDVFNDTSVHWFPYEKLVKCPTKFWESPAEPAYEDIEDLEIIRAKKHPSSTSRSKWSTFPSC